MITTLITSEEIQERIIVLAKQIDSNYKEPFVLIGLLKGSIMFISDLARALNREDVEIDFMAAASYVGTFSSRNVVIKKDLDIDVCGKNILIVEDIIDSGHTIDKIINILKTREPKSLKICSLLDKIERREIPVEIDYVGFKIPDHFVVGYGMDYNQKFRALPFIGVVKE